MVKIQPVSVRLPKTGTNVIKFIDNGVIKSKVVIPGPKNHNSIRVEKMITNYLDGKPVEIGLKFTDFIYATNHHVALKNMKPKFVDAGSGLGLGKRR